MQNGRQDIDLRFRDLLTLPVHRTALFNKSFSYNAVKFLLENISLFKSDRLKHLYGGRVLFILII